MSKEIIGFMFIAIAIIFTQAAHSNPSNTLEPNFYLGGIQVNEPDHDKWINNLESYGMNTVSVTVYATQGNWDSNQLWFKDRDDAVLNEIRVAKASGLNVVLILRVALDHSFPKNRFLWHGMIMPESDKELKSWFHKYKMFAIKWASVAQSEGVDALVIGSEMNALSSTKKIAELPQYYSYVSDESAQNMEMKEFLKFADFIDPEHLMNRGEGDFTNLNDYLEARIKANLKWARKTTYQSSEDRIGAINQRRDLLKDYWSDLIMLVRSSYKGKVSYAANFDNYFEVDFWNKLDFIGINAYFPLRADLEITEKPGQLITHFENKWKSILSEIALFRIENNINNKQVVFTELGYTFRKNSTLLPWVSEGFSLFGPEEMKNLVVWKEEPLDFNERALAIKALYNAYKQNSSDILKGILYWKFSTIKEHYEIEPFMVYLGSEVEDPALIELRKFVN